MAILTSQSCQCHHCLTSFTNKYKYYSMEESEVTSSLLEWVGRGNKPAVQQSQNAFQCFVRKFFYHIISDSFVTGSIKTSWDTSRDDLKLQKDGQKWLGLDFPNSLSSTVSHEENFTGRCSLMPSRMKTQKKCWKLYSQVVFKWKVDVILKYLLLELMMFYYVSL